MVALPSVAGELGMGFRPVRGRLPRLGGTWLGHWGGGDTVHCGREHRGGADLMSEVPGTRARGLGQASHLVNFVIFKLYLIKGF